MRELLEKKCLAILQKMDGVWPGYQAFSLEVGLSIHESMQLLNGLSERGLVEKIKNDDKKFAGWKIASGESNNIDPDIIDVSTLDSTDEVVTEAVVEDTPPEVIADQVVGKEVEVKRPSAKKTRKKK